MPLLLYIAIALLVATGLAHSILGERYILTRLFRRADLPRLFGGTAFTTGTLRFCWHLLTLAWWGLGYLLLLIAYDALTPARVLQGVAAVALLSALFPLILTRGRHLSWIVFIAVGALLLVASGKI